MNLLLRLYKLKYFKPILFDRERIQISGIGYFDYFIRLASTEVPAIVDVFQDSVRFQTNIK